MRNVSAMQCVRSCLRALGGDATRTGAHKDWPCGRRIGEALFQVGIVLANVGETDARTSRVTPGIAHARCSVYSKEVAR
jgi:hypothetical protein